MKRLHQLPLLRRKEEPQPKKVMPLLKKTKLTLPVLKNKIRQLLIKQQPIKL